MSVSKKTKAVLVGAAVAALVIPQTVAAGAAGAAAAQLHIDYNLSLGDYVGPLQFAKNGPHTYVADSFTSHLWEVGVDAPLVTGPDPSRGGEVGGVAINTDNGDVAYTTSDFRHNIKQLAVLHNGTKSMVSYIGSYEYRVNPDRSTIYGLLDPDRFPCAAATLRDHHVPVRYAGLVDSHPYAIAYLGGGSWAVADAAGNDIVRVGPTGDVSLISVLPRQALKITDALADALHLDKCAVGRTYYTESVPTDVEVGPGGLLYVSTLPGGPEVPAAGPRGKIYTIDRTSHETFQIGHGFSSPTNLAVTPSGAVYVAEPFLGRVVSLSNGMPTTRMSKITAVALESAGGHLYVSTAPGLTGRSNPARVSRLTYG